MPAIWKPQPKEVLISWIEAIVDEASEKLSEWETNFVNSCYDQLQYKSSLSEKQEKILEKIYAEKTS